MKAQEERIKLIEEIENNYLDYAVRRNPNILEDEQRLIREIADIAKGNKTYPSNLNDQLSTNIYYTANDFLLNLTSRYHKELEWTEKDELITGFLTKATLTQKHCYGHWNLIGNKLSMPFDTPGLDSFLSFIHSLGITDEMITMNVGVNYYSAFSTRNNNNEIVETYFANYIKPKLKDSSSLLGLKKTKGLGSVLDELVEHKDRRHNSHVVLKYIMENCPECINDFEKYVTLVNYHGNALNMAMSQS